MLFKNVVSILKEKQENSFSCFNKIFENTESQLTNYLRLSSGIKMSRFNKVMKNRDNPQN